MTFILPTKFLFDIPFNRYYNRTIKGKEIKAVKKILNKFCKSFGVKIKKGEGWSAYPKSITYPSKVENYNDAGFMELINKYYPDVKASEFTWSLLHEIGHSVTWNNFSKKAWKNYYKTAPYEHNIEKYFIIPQERVATDWAYNYIKNHPNKIKKLEAKLQKKLEKKGYTLYE